MSISSWLRRTKPPKCPLIGGRCTGPGCTFWQKFRGRDPQSDDNIDRWGCAVLWHNTLLVENSQLLNQAVSSIQSSRNENVSALGRVVEALTSPRGKRR